MAKPSSKEERDAREIYELDVDRMINEGMAGGTVHNKYDQWQIEESRELPKQEEKFSYKPEDIKHRHKTHR